MSTKKILSGVLFIVIPLILGVIVSLSVNQKQVDLKDVQATVLPEAKALPEFVLQNHLGEKFTNENLKGQWSFIFFGFTHCPDICPTTLSLLNEVALELEKNNVESLPKTVFVSVDPERDNQEQLAAYVPYFNPEFIGVTGSVDQLVILTKSLGVAFGKEEGSSADNYEMYHSARVMLVDPQARFKGLLSSPLEVKTIVEDYRKVSGS